MISEKEVHTGIKEIRWFEDSPDAGLPECVCSLCGEVITDPVPIRMFDEESGQEARFDKPCFDLVMRQPELPDIYTIYHPPFGEPLNWFNEASGKLPAAVKAFVGYYGGDGNESPPTTEQISMIIQYCTHYIFAPCWDGNGFAKELLQLRYEIQFVQMIDELSSWLHKALGIAIDPL